MTRSLPALGLLATGTATALTPLATHIDLQPVWDASTSTWSWVMRVDGDRTNVGNETGDLRDPRLNYMPVRPQSWEEGGDMLTRPDESLWDFMGAAAGEPIWFVPQTDNGYTWAGFNNTQAALFGAYTETDPRVAANGPQKWLKFRLKQVEGPAGGHVSVYNNYSDGSVIVWMATADGIGGDDTFFMPAGSHAHTNWAFTRKGLWRVSVTAQGFRGANQTNPTPESEAAAFIFAVGNHASWRATHYPSAEVMDESIAGPAADADRDGVVNLLEYAFGGDPKTASLTSEAGGELLPKHGLATSAGQSYLTLTYLRRKAETHPDITYAAEWQSGLDPAAWQQGGQEVSVNSLNATWEEVTVRDTAPRIPSTPRFARIRITQD